MPSPSDDADNERPSGQLELDLSVPPDSMGQYPVASLGSLATISRSAGLEHTADHSQCPACLQANLELKGVDVHLASMTFEGAAKRWIELRRQSLSLKPRTHETNQDYVNALNKFFSKLRLADITPGHLRGYQLARLHNRMLVAGLEAEPWIHAAGHARINHEISVLQQMLSHCRLWQRISPFYFPLPVKSWSPRQILTEEEEERLFARGLEHPEAQLACWIAAITNNTTASGCELRGLRLKNGDLYT